VREVDIVYLYEHAGRELDVACAVAAILERDHLLSVEIVQWPVGFGRVVHKLRPKKMVILPYCYVETDFSPLLAYWRGIHYVNLTWEQLFYPGNERMKTPRGEYAIRDVLHHVWSEHYVDLLRKNGVSDENIFLNGQPAFTLYDEPYRLYFTSREKLAQRYSLDPSKKWLFFPENYNWAFYSKGRLDQFIRDGLSPDQVDTMREYCDLSLNQVLHWFKTLVQSIEGVEIIIRPRPSTTVDQFISATQNCLGEIPAGVKIIQDGTVREWILSSDLILSSHSTSLIEGAVAGKQVFMIEPYPIPAVLQVVWHQFLPRIRNFDDLFNICTHDEEHKLVDGRLADWARNNLMSKGDSIHNLVIFLSELMHAPARPPQSHVLQNATRYPPVGLWVIYRNLRRLYFYWRTQAIEPVFLKDMVSQSEIAGRKMKWLEIL
jgi:surface carbohydrate biosynthesis protein